MAIGMQRPSIGYDKRRELNNQESQLKNIKQGDFFAYVIELITTSVPKFKPGYWWNIHFIFGQLVCFRRFYYKDRSALKADVMIE